MSLSTPRSTTHSRREKCRFDATQELNNLFNVGKGQCIEDNLEEMRDCIRRHECGFVVIEDVLNVMPTQALHTWADSVKVDTQIFNSKDGEHSKTHLEKVRFQSAPMMVEETPPELGVKNIQLLASGMSCTLEHLKLLKSVRDKKKAHQKPHSDFSFEKQHWRYKRKKAIVCSMIGSLEGMRLDMWGTSTYYDSQGIDPPRHPYCVPEFELVLKPGAIVLFRHDMFHAGSAYEKLNYRLFGVFIPFVDKGVMDTSVETTYYPHCHCQWSVVQEAERLAREQHRAVANFINYDKEKKGYILPECQCSKVRTRDPKVATYEKWAKTNPERSNNVFRWAKKK